MARSATLAIKIVSDASQASQGFDAAESKVAKFQGGLDRASVAAGGLLAGLGAVAKEAYDAASNLQQSSGAVESVFAGQSRAIVALAEGAAQAVGLSQNSYQELASVLGAQLKGMGYANEKLTSTTDDLIKMGADLAATFGGTTSEAVSALSSLLRGERDPIERYGIALNQAAIDARATADGLDKNASPAAKRAAQAQATLALVAQQAAGAQGAFGREADTAAGQTQRAAASFEDAKAKLGDILLPVVADGAQKFASLTGSMAEHSTATQVLIGIVGGLAVAVLAVNMAMRLYAAGQAIATAASWAFNASLWANPITWVVIAIAALVAAVVIAYNKFKWFRDLVQSVWEWLKKAWDFAGKLLRVVGSTFFEAPAPAPAPAGGGGSAGSWGAAPGAPVAAGAVYGVPMTALGGGGSTASQGPAPAASTTVNVTINGAVDPMASGRQLVKLLKEYGVATGGQVVVTIGNRT